MDRVWRFARLTLLCLTSLLANGCSGCSADPFAELISAQGEVTRDFNVSLGDWTTATVGAEFEIGEALRTSQNSEASVRFDDGARLKLEASTTIRFLAVAPESGERGIDLEAGNAILETSGGMKLRTGIGLAVIEGSSVLKLTRHDDGIRFLVNLGLARLEAPDGTVTEVRPGESIEVGIGMAIMDRVLAPSAEPTPTATPLTSPAPKGPLVVAIVGAGALVQPPGSQKFQALPEGESEVTPGSRLKLSAKNSARVIRDKSAAALSGPGTYLVGGQGVDFVRLENGTLLLDAAGRTESVAVPGGTLTALAAKEGATARVEVRNDQVNVLVKRGQFRAELHGKVALLTAGESLRASQREFTISGRGLEFADVTTSAGAGLMIHDPNPPTAVGIIPGEKCPHLGIVEMKRGGRVLASAVARSQANLHFSQGTSDYDLRCLSEEGELSAVVGGGRVTVIHDAGTAALAKRPPTTAVQVDGRSYTVLYQNRLPGITVRWPNAPQAASYIISVHSSSGTKRITSQHPQHTFESGSLLEGTHGFSFAASNGRVSRKSSVAIRFDNAAPKASIAGPSSESFAPGASVKISGLSLPGWTVSVNGAPLPMDNQHRFSGQATATSRGLVLRFENEQRGAHLYLRRAAGIPR